MVGEFSDALGAALGTFVTEVGDAVGDSLPTVLALVLGLVGIWLLWRLIRALMWAAIRDSNGGGGSESWRDEYEDGSGW